MYVLTGSRRGKWSFNLCKKKARPPYSTPRSCLRAWNKVPSAPAIRNDHAWIFRICQSIDMLPVSGARSSTSTSKWRARRVSTPPQHSLPLFFFACLSKCLIMKYPVLILRWANMPHKIKSISEEMLPNSLCANGKQTKALAMYFNTRFRMEFILAQEGV